MHSVYEPQEDSYLLLDAAKKAVKAASVLEVGTGSGIIASEIAEKAKSVLAVDVNKAAIAHCKKIKKRNLSFKESDLFSKVSGSFDVIIFNPPYLPYDKDEPEDIRLATTGGKHGYEIIERFLSDVASYLSTEGKIFLLFSTLTHKDVVEEKIAENLLSWREVASKKIAFETLYVYELTKSNALKNLERRGISDIKPFAHGHRGLIFTGTYEGKKVAIKMQRPDIETFTIGNEITQLRRLNKEGIGPDVLFSGNDYFGYAFVEGDFILDALKKRKKKHMLEIIDDCLRQCRTLDSLMLNKEEMHHPTKHVIVKEDNSVTLIDFERCKLTRKPKNVTQFCQFLTSGTVKQIIEPKGIVLDASKILKSAQFYKKKLGDEEFRVLRDLILH